MSPTFANFACKEGTIVYRYVTLYCMLTFYGIVSALMQQ